ncbi:radical SAM protein [Aquimarina sp. TRL1]|uniref:radical SAM protein n=1 Tax=Aquimarina sp. (strain TRL1) TaxID=2736252 RepID=UPI001588DC64|nr:radical SAM protein [Aquimarina sp. TRL1]QKX07354.1 radical SAM protein [Aquimarina sp. TRL1]
MEFDALVVKVASRCNLNCSYCFMYNMGDTTYKKQPKYMDADCVDAILEKTIAYLKKYPRKKFTFIFHGGEPLLIDKAFYREFVYKAEKAREQLLTTSFEYDMQTNGVLIDKEWCSLFKELAIFPSISVDGTEKAHDMYRVDHKGRGSYQAVRKGVQLLKRETGLATIACVINTEEDPIVIYNSFKEMGAHSVNYLIPDYTYDNVPFDPNTDETSMADWLIQLFDHWIADPDKYIIPIFKGLINSLLGITDHEHNESKVLVIETNGEIEAIDSLKACGQGFTKSKMKIQTHSFTDILTSPLGRLYFENSTHMLCSQCKACPILEICKGGRLVHRFKKENGFNNPSIYCRNLIQLIAHVQHRLMDIFPSIYEDSNISMIDTSEIIEYLHTVDLTTEINEHTKELISFAQ